MFAAIPGNPFRYRIPEWFGDDRIEDGQLETDAFFLGYSKLPEKECDKLLPL